MSHALITGVTESGKTTFARALARELAKRKENVIVYDPVGTPTAGGGWPEKAIVFQDQKEFWKYLERDDVYGAHVFIDEAGDIFNASEPENCKFPRKARHFNFSLYMITQRPTMIVPNARTQAATIYMFRLATSDAREICADAGHNWPPEGISEKGEFIPLDTGDFLVLHSGSVRVERHNIFDRLKTRRKEMPK